MGTDSRPIEGGAAWQPFSRWRLRGTPPGGRDTRSLGQDQIGSTPLPMSAALSAIPLHSLPLWALTLMKVVEEEEEGEEEVVQQ